MPTILRLYLICPFPSNSRGRGEGEGHSSFNQSNYPPRTAGARAFSLKSHCPTILRQSKWETSLKESIVSIVAAALE